MLLWWTNGEVNKRSIAQPGPEFKQGRTLSKATKVKIRESRGGNTLSDENKKKISDSTKGLLLWNNGIKPPIFASAFQRDCSTDASRGVSEKKSKKHLEDKKNSLPLQPLQAKEFGRRNKEIRSLTILDKCKKGKKSKLLELRKKDL